MKEFVRLRSENWPEAWSSLNRTLFRRLPGPFIEDCLVTAAPLPLVDATRLLRSARQQLRDNQLSFQLTSNGWYGNRLALQTDELWGGEGGNRCLYMGKQVGGGKVVWTTCNSRAARR